MSIPLKVPSDEKDFRHLLHVLKVPSEEKDFRHLLHVYVRKVKSILNLLSMSVLVAGTTLGLFS